MANDNQNATEKDQEQALTFEQRLAAKGWIGYFLAARVENLNNPDTKQISLGFSDAMGKKLIVINASSDEWLRIYAEMAKKLAMKG